MKQKNYWSCVVAVESDGDLQAGADFPLRNAVAGACKSINVEIESIRSGWGLTERHSQILKSRIEQDKAICDRLFEKIKHGDDDHKKWLHDALKEFFNA